MADQEIPIANGCDYEDKCLFLFHFGAYGWTKLYVWADHLEDAFEVATEWLDDNAPGLLTSFDLEDYKRTADELDLKWQDHWPDFEDERFCKVAETTEADHTPIGHTTLKNGTHIPSWEWTADEVDPTHEAFRETILRSECEAA